MISDRWKTVLPAQQPTLAALLLHPPFSLTENRVWVRGGEFSRNYRRIAGPESQCPLSATANSAKFPHIIPPILQGQFRSVPLALGGAIFPAIREKCRELHLPTQVRRFLAFATLTHLRIFILAGPKFPQSQQGILGDLAGKDCGRAGNSFGAVGGRQNRSAHQPVSPVPSVIFYFSGRYWVVRRRPKPGLPPTTRTFSTG